MKENQLNQEIEDAYDPKTWHYCKCGFKKNVECDCDCHYPKRWQE